LNPVGGDLVQDWQGLVARGVFDRRAVYVGADVVEGEDAEIATVSVL
jgi:hypothetical protein